MEPKSRSLFEINGVIDDGVCGEQAVERSGRTDQPAIQECLVNIAPSVHTWMCRRGKQIVHVATEFCILVGVLSRWQYSKTCGGQVMSRRCD